MKFKEGAIQPEMVIHCPTENGADALLGHLEELGYTRRNGEPVTDIAYLYGEETVFLIENNKTVLTDRKRYHAKAVELSDLIEPDAPMTAKELLEWFNKAYNTECAREEAFGCTVPFARLLEIFTSDEIIEKITAYEAAKNTPKPVEFEWVDVVRIIKEEESGRSVCVCERDIIGADTDELVNQGVESALKEYIAEHEGKYFAIHQKQCRVRAEE